MVRKYAVIDLETTGPKYESGDRIFQFGCTLIDGDEVIEHVSLNINPEKSIPFEIQLLTGVTNADVATAPYFDEVAMTIFNLLEDRTLVAHNVGFDGPFIMSALTDALGLKLEVPLIDTVQLAQICYPTALSYRLSDLTETLEIRHTQVHTAGSDARATAELFLKMKTKFRELSTITLKQLTEFSGELLGDTGTIFEEILEEKGKEEREDFPLEQGFVISPLAVKEVELKSSKRKMNALEPYQKLVDSGFLEDKASQREMIATIESLIETDEPLHFIEASPGSGKTYAYLLAAFEKASKRKPIWIVTSNLLLQQQLMEDSVAPIITELKIKTPVISIKGQRHYIDLTAFKRAIHKYQEERSARNSLSIMGLLVWITKTQTGDLSECNQALHQATLWKEISVKDANEEGSLYWDKAVASVQQSPIVVTNHAFLIQYASLIAHRVKPVVLIDEVQQFEHALEQYGTTTVNFSHLFELQQLWSDHHLNAMFHFSKEEEHLSRTMNRKLLEICDLYETWFEELKSGQQLSSSFVFTSSEWKESIHCEMVNAMQKALSGVMNLLQANADKTTLFEESSYLLKELMESISLFQTDGSDYFVIEEKEQYGQNTLELLRVKPVIEVFNQFREKMRQLIGISATIPTFTPLFHELEAKEKLTVIETKAETADHQIFIPNDLVAVNSSSSQQYHAQIADCIEKIYERKGGRMLVLMHSVEALLAVESLLEDFCRTHQIELLAQKGHQMGRRIQRRFQERNDAILLGVYSFWEGFDSGGQSIDSLVITKLPFPNPVSTAQQIIQLEMKEQERSYFGHYAMKMMLLQLYQGLGRFSRPHQKSAEIWLLDVRATISKYAMKVKSVFPENATVIEKPFKKCLNVGKNKNM